MKKSLETRKIVFAISMIIASFMLNSCATILSGSSQDIFVNTKPQGANVYVDGKDQGVITPAKLAVKRKKQAVYTFQKQGYEDGTVIKQGSFNFVTFGNILLGGVIGLAVDFSTGATWQYRDSNVFCQLNSSDSIISSATQERETSDILLPYEPYNKTLEHTSIRWNIDSDPSDSGIFWRVISDITDQVENTIEKYLGTTPFKETHTLSIAGLTYENSQDVTIEIKIIKTGYGTQIKHYNLRQVIDKQEISDLFKLVKINNK